MVIGFFLFPVPPWLSWDEVEVQTESFFPLEGPLGSLALLAKKFGFSGLVASYPLLFPFAFTFG
jgi:hypothetical protein